MDMTEFNDAPSLFGIFYEDLRKNTVTKSRLSHDKFWDLLIEDKRKNKKQEKVWMIINVYFVYREEIIPFFFFETMYI